MHEHVIHGYLFGCSEAADNINRYIQSSPSWHIAREAINITDPSGLSERLFLLSLFPGRAQFLVLVFCLYQSAHGEARALSSDGVIPSPIVAQRNAVQAARRAFRLHMTKRVMFLKQQVRWE